MKIKKRDLRCRIDERAAEILDNIESELHLTKTIILERAIEEYAKNHGITKTSKNE